MSGFNDFNCGICFESFPTLEVLNAHRDEAHVIGTHFCVLCKEDCRQNIKLHLQLIHKLKDVVSCDCCHFFFSEKEAMENHKKLNSSITNTGVLAKGNNSPGSYRQEVVILDPAFGDYHARKVNERYHYIVEPNDTPYDTALRFIKALIDNLPKAEEDVATNNPNNQPNADVDN